MTGAGADPGTVFTDSNGNANCYVQFGSVPSPPNGSQELFDALVGGVASLQNPNLNNGATGVPFGYSQPSAVYAVVTPSTPGAVKIVSGNNQSANPGAAVAAPLVVQALDTSGNPLAGLPVSWAISPSTGGVVNPVNANTDANGQASATVTLSSSAVGNVAVNAKVTGNGVTVSSQAFTITVNTQVTGLTIASGNNQSAQVGQPFAQPLVVQVVTAGGQNVQGLAVQFAVTSGSGTLSASSAATGPTGLAQVNATAGGTAGPLTVVASIAGITQTFSLTVTPPPPPISSNSFLNGAGFYATSGSQLTALSPCSVGTIVVGNPLAAAAIPTTLNMFPAALQQPGNVSVSIGTTAVPILNVSAASTGQQLITFQQPCELPPANYTYTITINGVSTQIPNVTVRPGSPGIFEIISSDGVRRTLAVRPDGSIVSLQNPARRGEFVRIYITGVGPMQPALVTGQLPTPGVDSIPVDPNQVVVGLNGNGVGAVTVRAAPDLLGVAIVAFQVPIDATPSNNGVLAVGVTALGNPTQYQQPGGSKLPIQ